MIPAPEQAGYGLGCDAGALSGDAAVISASWRDPERFGVLFDAHFAVVHRYVEQRLGPDAADDIAAETFLVAFRRRHSYDLGQASARPWLYGIATNLMGGHRRREAARYKALARGTKAAACDGDALADRVADRVTASAAAPALTAALARLAARDRDVLLLAALAGLSYEEIARALGIPYGTVCSRLSRARRTLRAALSELAGTLDGEERTGGLL